MDKTVRIRELVDILNRAAKAYYKDAKEIMSNNEYDRLYDELIELEEETGLILSASPSRNVGYEILSELPKMNHDLCFRLIKQRKYPTWQAFWVRKRGFFHGKWTDLPLFFVTARESL